VKFRSPTRPAARIDIAPLVDVVFLLVIFFALTTTFLETSGLELELPASHSTAQREPRELTVMMDSDGQVSFAGEIVDLAGLGERLARALDQQERKVVVLRADTAARHGDVVRIMDVIRDAGAEALTVAARSAPE
jgi:biopolymer transport protein ExbD